MYKDCEKAETVIASDKDSFCLTLTRNNYLYACQFNAVTTTSAASTPSSSSPSPSDNGTGISLVDGDSAYLSGHRCSGYDACQAACAQGYRVTVSVLQYTLNSVASNLPGGCTCYVLGGTLQSGVVTSTSSGVGILFLSVKAALAFLW